MSYDTLVLNGNSTNAVYTLGALQRLYDERILVPSNLKRYFGTSSGAFISLLLAVEFDPLEILSCLCVNESYSKVCGFNMANLGKGGILNFAPIENEVENWVVSKLGYVPTMEQVKNKFGKELYFVTYNMTDGRKEYASYETFPRLSVIVAARMSSTFPFVFPPFEHDGKYYVDGGVVDNFAMNKAQSLGGKCLGLCNVNENKPYDPSMSVLEMFFRLFSVFVCSSADNATAFDGNEIIKLIFESSFFDFTSANADLVRFFDIGYDKCKRRRMTAEMLRIGK